MKIRTFFILFSTLAAAIPAVVSGDDFEDMIMAFNDVKASYRTAMDADPGSGIVKEYREKLKRLDETSSAVSAVIKKMALGADFEFQAYSQRLKNSFQARVPFEGESKRRGKIEVQESAPAMVVHLMQNDISQLKIMKFTTENGGSIDPRYQNKMGLVEFKRNFKFFQTHLDSSVESGTYSLWRRYYEIRLDRMSALARQFNLKLTRERSPICSQYNLPAEVNNLATTYSKLTERCNELNSSKTNNNNSGKRGLLGSKGSGKKKISTEKRLEDSTTKKLMEEINFSTKKIEDALDALDKADFRSEGRPVPAAVDPSAAPAVESEADKMLESLSDSELKNKVNALRDAIYKQNQDMNGVDAAVLDQYLNTLSKKQRRQYYSFVEKYRGRNFPEATAQSSALRELHSMLSFSGAYENRTDLLNILKKKTDAGTASPGNVSANGPAEVPSAPAVPKIETVPQTTDTPAAVPAAPVQEAPQESMIWK